MKKRDFQPSGLANGQAIIVAFLSLTVLFLIIGNSNDAAFLEVAAQKRRNYTWMAIHNVSWNPKHVLLIAHRGCISRFPENSLAAIAACAEEGAHVAEIDLRMTKDGHLVLMHDKTPARTTNRAHWKEKNKTRQELIFVQDLNLRELQSDYWLVQNEYTGAVTNFRIPTFTEALGVAKACGIHLYVEGKGHEDDKGKVHVDQKAKFEEAIVEALSETDSFDLVLHHQFHESAATKEGTKARVVVKTNDKLKSTATLWEPNGTSLPHSSSELCKLRHDSGVGSIYPWRQAEYFIRDPDKVASDIPVLKDVAKAELTHEACPESVDMEQPCMGAHLYQPLTKATCARLLFTDLPATARAALLASGQMAPATVYPLDKIVSVKDGTFHRLPKIPACLEKYLDSQKQEDASAPDSGRFH